MTLLQLTLTVVITNLQVMTLILQLKSTTGNAFQDSNLGGNMTFNPDGQLKVKTGIFLSKSFPTGNYFTKIRRAIRSFQFYK
jgi:hypothetical protein